MKISLSQSILLTGNVSLLFWGRNVSSSQVKTAEPPGHGIGIDRCMDAVPNGVVRCLERQMEAQKYLLECPQRWDEE